MEAAQAAGVSHLVYASMANADPRTGIPHFDSKLDVEQALRASGVPFTILGPVFFMENYLGPMFLPALSAGVLPMAMSPRRPLQHIAVENIGTFASIVIERREAFLGSRIDLASDERTPEQVVKILSAASGREIRFQPVPLEALRAESEDFARLFEWLETTGYSADIASLRRDYPEVGWLDLEDWAGRQDWSRYSSATMRTGVS